MLKGWIGHLSRVHIAKSMVETILNHLNTIFWGIFKPVGDVRRTFNS